MRDPEDSRKYDIEEVRKIASLFFGLGEAAALTSKQHQTWYERKNWRMSHLRIHLQGLENEHFRDTSQDSKTVILSGNYYEDIWESYRELCRNDCDESVDKVPEKALPKSVRKKASESTSETAQENRGYKKRSKTT
jgi:hypothetical protein